MSLILSPKATLEGFKVRADSTYSGCLQPHQRQLLVVARLSEHKNRSARAGKNARIIDDMAAGLPNGAASQHSWMSTCSSAICGIRNPDDAPRVSFRSDVETASHRDTKYPTAGQNEQPTRLVMRVLSKLDGLDTRGNRWQTRSICLRRPCDSC